MFRQLIILCFLLFYKNSESFPVIDEDSKINDEHSAEDSERDLTLLFEAGRQELGIDFDDPIIMKKFSYQNDFGPIRVNAFVKEVAVHGFRKYKEFHLSLDKKNQLIRFEIQLPNAFFETNTYKLGGNVGFFPIKGSGQATVEVFDVFIEGHAEFEKVLNEEGETVIHLKNPVIEILDLRDLNIRLSGMFDGNPMLGALSNFIANNYWKEIIEVVRPDLLRITADFMADQALNPILKKNSFVANYID